MNSKFKTNKTYFCSFFVAALMFALLFGVLVFVQKKASDVNYLKDFLLKKYNLVLDCKEINAGYSWNSFFIKSPALSVSPKDEKPFLELSEPYLKIKILPLLTGKVSFSEFSTSSLSVEAKRLEDGEIDILKYIKPSKKSFLKADFSSLKASVFGYKVKFSDLTTKNSLVLKGDYFATSNLNPRKKFAVNTQGIIEVFDGSKTLVSPYVVDIDYAKHKNKISLKRNEVLLSGFNLSFLKGYLQGANFDKFDGVIDFYSSVLEDGFYQIKLYSKALDVEFDLNGEKNTIKADKPVILQTAFKLSGKDFEFKDGEFLTEGVDLSFFGKIKNLLSSGKHEADINLSFENTEVKNTVALLPDTAIPLQEQYIKNIKLENLNGIVNGNLNIVYKGSDDYNVKGKLNFDDVYVSERPKNAKTSFGECEFLGREVLFTVYANAPKDSVLTVVGKTQMRKMPVGEFFIKSYGKLDMQFAHGILMPVQRILALKLGPLPFMTLKGDGEIDLHTKGTKVKSEMEGNFVTNNATVTLEGLNTVLYNGSVKIDFAGSDIIFEGAQGIIEGAKTYIDGKSNTLGDLNIDVKVLDVSAKNAIKIAQTSDIVTSALDGGEFLKTFKPSKGNVDFYLNISGNVPPDAVFGQQSDTVLAKGKILFKGVDLKIDPEIKGTNVNGVLTFENDAKFDLSANIFDSPFKITGNVEQKGVKNKIVHNVPSTLSLRFVSDKLKSSSVGNFIEDNISLFVPQNRMFALNLAKLFKTNKFLIKGDVSAKGLVYSNSSELDLSGFDFGGFLEGVRQAGSEVAFNGGNITLNGKNVKFNKLNMSASGVGLILDGNIDKFASLKPFNNLRITFLNSSFAAYAEIFKKILPQKTQAAFENFSDFKGTISGKIRLFANFIDGDFVPNNLSFYDNKTKNNIVLKGGKIKFKNDKTLFKAFNFSYGDLPIYFDGFMQTDGNVNPEFNLLVSTNLSEENCDKLLNPYLRYPLLLRGEAMVKGRILGRLDSYTTYLTAVLNEGSDLSFMGLTLGDTDVKREMSSKIRFKGNYANVDYFRYFKYILSQNNKQTPYDLINISGGIKLSKGDVLLDNLKLFTPNSAPVRFLNVLFKKSIIKDGLFNSNLVLNGSVNEVKAVGTIDFSNVFVPVYNSVIENIKIYLDKTKGRASFKVLFFDTPLDFNVEFLNKASLPFVAENVSVHSDVVSINNLMKALTAFATPSSGPNTQLAVNPAVSFTPSDVQIKKGTLTVDKIIFNDVEANDLKLGFVHGKDATFEINNAYLGIAGGLIKGSGQYNFDAKSVNVNSDFINCDANELTKAFFNLQGQIFGNANGKVSFSMKDFAPNDYVDKIKADAEFQILNGRMPKLGSIEYLLRASNFFKSGVFGLTINNVIQLLTPYKHGDFNKISGNFKVADASIKDLKIYSQGENLSTYTYGTYDIVSGHANIEVLGKLSKNVSNLLGAVGNASINSVINAVTRNKMNEIMKNEVMKNVNKIPFISIGDDDFRIFNVKLSGKVSTEDVVKSFTWLN